MLTLSDLWGLTLTGTPASCVSHSSILLYVALSVSTRMSPLYRRLTDFSVPICALRALPSTKGESLERVCSGSAASITNNLGKLSGESSVLESPDPGHDLFSCQLIEDVEGFLVLMLFESFQQSCPTRGERAQVPGTLPWWVRDCDSKVTGKVLVGHAGLRSPIATWPPRLTFVGMSGLLLNLTRTSDGADWALAATSASRLGSSLRAKVVC